jgi:signal transduction histidine kinase/two-component SAPR family response regulator/HPt (histidine-containing phosphotransfer) domain-containing protein
MAAARRILIIDDNKDIHADFRKVFERMSDDGSEIASLEAVLFERAGARRPALDGLHAITIDSAYQGEDGIQMVLEAAQSGAPYDVAFVDVRMPPGIDGIQTIKRLWARTPDLLCVICTAFSDYPWEAIVTELGKSSNLLILKKPFDAIEVLQLTQALMEKVSLAQAVQANVETLERKVRELTRAETELQRYNRDLLEAKSELEQKAAELIRKSEQLEAARAAAELANRTKSEFLANISHELRTPLNGVIGMMHLMLKTDLNDRQGRYVRTATSSAEMLLKLINDILDLSKVEAGKLELETIDFDLGLAVENVVELLADGARRKGLEIACAIHPDVPSAVQGDPGRLRQVLTNLTSNAVRFTESGEVVVRAEPLQETDRTAKVRFSVSDTGIGVTEDRVGRLFQLFTQGDSSTTRRYGGTGLGLAISKRLCELMGGEIGVERHHDRGTTFWFTLELGKQPAKPKRRSAALAAGLQGLRVLVVDDNVTCHEILRQQLGAWGFECQAAHEGATALEMLAGAAEAGTPFGLAIVDWVMPGVDGARLAASIRADARLRETALVMLSYLGDQADALGPGNLGFDACLTKPVLQSQLLDAIARAVSGRKAHQSGWRGRGTEPAARAATRPPAPKRAAQVLLAEDNEINQFMVVETLRWAGYSCDVVPDGKQAVEVLRRARYDLVLMDCFMPEMDGLEATRKIRQDERSRVAAGEQKQVPIIALTANAISGDREACLEAGMTDYLSKPLDPDKLIQTVEYHLSEGAAAPTTGAPYSQNRVDDPAGPAACLPAPHFPVASPPINEEDLLQRCMGDRDFAGCVLARFVGQLGAELDEIESGIACGDAEQVMHLSHRLKGAAANLAASPLQALASRLEATARGGNLAGAAACFAELRHACRDLSEYCLRREADRPAPGTGTGPRAAASRVNRSV